MVEDLIAHWASMESLHEQIQSEIRHAIKHGKAGDAIDVRQWEKVLGMPTGDDWQDCLRNRAFFNDADSGR